MKSNKNINNLLKLIQTSHEVAFNRFQIPILSPEKVNNWLLRNSKFYAEIEGIKTYDEIIEIYVNGLEVNNILISRLLLGSSFNYLLDDFSTWRLLEVYHINRFVLLKKCQASIEFDFLNLCGYDELLDAYQDFTYFGYSEDAMELNRLKGLLNPFLFFMKNIYNEFTIENFENWDELDKEVENKLNFIKLKGQEVGDKYNVYKFKDYEPFKN